MQSFELERRIDAPVEVAFGVITDHAAYPEFTPLRAARLEKPGEGAPNGVGAIRALAIAGPPIREEITAYEEPSRLAYRVISGVPVMWQKGDVRIEPDGAGSLMRYRVEFEPLVPLTGFSMAAAMKVGIGHVMRCVAKESERRAADR